MSLLLAVRAAVILLPLALSACASAPPPQYPNDHPASSAAPVAPRSLQSQTLRSYRATTSSASTPISVAPPDERIASDAHIDHRTEPSSDPTHRLLQKELSVDTAVQIALLNNRDLQSNYASLGIAQADLVEAGLLENPVFSYTYYTGGAGSIVEASIVQDFVSVLSLSARKKVGQAAADRVVAETAQRVLDLAWQVRTQYYVVLGDSQALDLMRQIVSATDAAAELARRQLAAGNLNRRDQAVQQAFYAQALLDASQAEMQLSSDRKSSIA